MNSFKPILTLLYSNGLSPQFRSYLSLVDTNNWKSGLRIDRRCFCHLGTPGFEGSLRIATNFLLASSKVINLVLAPDALVVFGHIARGKDGEIAEP